MGAPAFVASLGGPYYPAGGGETLAFKVTTAVNTVQRLGTLLTVPTIGGRNRPPNHVLFQVPAAAANPIYMTYDNNTVPVVGGPGIELEPGTIIKMEFSQKLLTVQVGGQYPVNALTAFQFIAVAATVLLVTFTDSDQ